MGNLFLDWFRELGGAHANQKEVLAVMTLMIKVGSRNVGFDSAVINNATYTMLTVGLGRVAAARARVSPR